MTCFYRALRDPKLRLKVGRSAVRAPTRPSDPTFPRPRALSKLSSKLIRRNFEHTRSCEEITLDATEAETQIASHSFQQRIQLPC